MSRGTGRRRRRPRGHPLRGDERDGTRFEPTLLTNVPHGTRVLALDACVFTADYDRARRVADGLRAGAVRINGAPSHGLGDISLGGMGASGIGREGIGRTIGAFTTTKTVVL